MAASAAQQAGTAARPCLLLQLLTGTLLVLAVCPAAMAQSEQAVPDAQHTHWKPWYGAGSWGTLSSLFFTLSAVFADLLLMRLMLVLAYVCLLVAAVLGFPNVTDWTYQPSSLLLVGPIAWASVSLVLHVWAFMVLLLDERPIRLSGRDEQLWRCFYRRCGMARIEFKQMQKCGRWRHFKAGEVIEHRGVDPPALHIIYQGCVSLQPTSSPCSQSAATAVVLRSGQLVNKYLCNLFGIFLGFEAEVRINPWVIALTDVTCFSWDIPALLRMSSGASSVALPSYWRSFQLYEVGAEFCTTTIGTPMYCSSGQDEPPGWLQGQPSQDFVRPLGPDEQDRPTVKGFCMWILKSLNPWPPVGLRHQANPKTGALASARVLLAAQLRQASMAVPQELQKQVQAAGSDGRSVIVGGAPHAVTAAAAAGGGAVAGGGSGGSDGSDAAAAAGSGAGGAGAAAHPVGLERV